MGKQAAASMGDNKTRTFLMMLGIIIGVATLTIITSSVLGARAKVMKNVGKFGFDQLAVFCGFREEARCIQNAGRHDADSGRR